MSDLEALIGTDFLFGGVSIVWARDVSGGRQVSNGTTVWTITPDGVEHPEVEPLRLRDEYARTLLAALLRHYNGADDARMLRKDYDAERARGDKLIDLATRPPLILPAASS